MTWLAAAGTAYAMIKRLLLLLACLSAALLRADETGEAIARQHAERAGGRLAQLRGLYAEGRTLIKGEVVAIRLWAERPNRLRVESFNEQRKVVQCFDGALEPWLSHSDAAAGAPQRMALADRKDFLSNADFDGPLVDHRAKGYEVEYAGAEVVAGRPAKKILVMNQANDVFFLWIDDETHEILRRAVYRMNRGQRILVDTFFSDFREVGGVLQPHRIETKVGENTLYLMVISQMVPNPTIAADLFAAPKGWPALTPEDRPAVTSRPGS